jgi:hypothetical protein
LSIGCIRLPQPSSDRKPSVESSVAGRGRWISKRIAIEIA